MNGNDREAIRTYLDEEFAIVDEETGAVSIVGMVHHAHSGPSELHVMKTGHVHWGNGEEMARTFDMLASRHARGVSGGGAQQYELSICRGAKDKKTSVLPFVRVGPANITGPQGSIATEPPTTTGLTQQAQRWGEQITQAVFAQIQHLFHALQTALDRANQKLEVVEREKGELWLALKGVLMELGKQRHSERMAELTAARMHEFQKQVMILAPAILNMMSGREVFPLSTADTAVLDTIAAWASPDDLRMLTGVLSSKTGGETIATTLVDRFDKYHKRKAAEAAEERRLMSDLPSRNYEESERDAMGDAIKALKGQPRDDEPTPKALTNGSTAKVVATIDAAEVMGQVEGEDTELFQGLVDRVPEGQLEMLTEVLGRGDPEFGERLKQRLQTLQKKR